MNTWNETLSIFALGGVYEIGKNMYGIQYGDEIVLIDCGSKFPDESYLGIDLIIPDISYLLENQEKVRALIVTHGHEDHIGGIPYFLRQLNVPVYGTRLTLGLIELKLKEHNLLHQSTLISIDRDSTISLGSLTISFFQTNHSIPDCLGVVFETKAGSIVHTGDFKFDLTPVHQQSPDLHRMAEIGQKGVLALLSESTNAERPGFTPSEKHVGDRLLEAFNKAQQKIFVSTFASNVYRLQQVIDAAEATNRKLALLGRSMVNVVKIASEQGYLHIPEDMLVEIEEVSELDPARVAVLCTGSQGEPMAALSRLSTSGYRHVKVERGDTVILSSSPIPGNERNVARIVDNLFIMGANVIYGSGTGMHVSGHGFQEELKLMLTLMKPKYFIPIHGEYRMLHQHRLLAESVGVDFESIFIVNNGDVVDIHDGVAVQERKIPAGNTLVDGLGIGDVGNGILRDRKHLSEDGILVIVVTRSKTDGKILSGPDLISRGFIHAPESEGLLEEATRIASEVITNLQEANVSQWNRLKQGMRESIGKFVYAKTKRRPMILPIIMDV
ncbi:ribonuclease J [Brevibacillus formosus]|uniref:ribonuclease J n=1 Tax=Brevibacillus TaxID=55080 RepID=UPI000D106E47|nr:MULTISPECIES: ribonuclease J [Brevibacillus]MBG9940663.1 ribonuclease J [Brevibacillus formosus]MED1944555.1 ribonuclease J [Brevibacillus formosus]MED1999073.1 ribonuclease J [Brevibacillus formosus]MED2082790.1 ribonuclease J [Brevibacillus formosus]PSK10173.1 ribonuclease J [Brevibacillus sp. NRRL NRS-603]